jgi:AAA+ ATPase superfamily predicted ATPase
LVLEVAMGAQDEAHVRGFVDSTTPRSTLGLLYGRRRIGKSTLLVRLAREYGGFYYEATRVGSRLQLQRLGRELGEHLGVGQVVLESWEAAVRALLRLGERGITAVVLDELGYVLEDEPSVDSVLAAALGPGGRRGSTSRTRLIVCGSAIAMMRALTGGEAPLRGRAAMELVMQPDDYRVAAARMPDPEDLAAAARTFAVIGGVVGYATDMVDHDLPTSAADVDRWILQRVLSPAATLHREAATLLAEDPTLTAGAVIHHSILGAVANEAVTAGRIANALGKPVSNLAPALGRLVDAGFVVRLEDPARAQRPLYALADPFLQFHYAVLEPHGATLRDRDPREVWDTRLAAVFDSRVRGPVFEEQARTFLRRFVALDLLGDGVHVGPSQVSVGGVERQLDVVVTASGEVPAERRVLALGEAKAGEVLDVGRLRRLEEARAAYGPRAAGAALWLFGPTVDPELARIAASRSDVEIVDLARLYHGS